MHTAVNKKRPVFSGGYISLNDTHPTNKIRFITSSKGKRSYMKPKNTSKIKDISTNTNFTRIYTPQNYMKRDRKRIKKNSSKTKTMINSECDFKTSVEPLNISSIKESNMSTN